MFEASLNIYNSRRFRSPTPSSQPASVQPQAPSKLSNSKVKHIEQTAKSQRLIVNTDKMSTQQPTLKSSMKTTVTQKPKLQPKPSTSTSTFRGNATQQHSLRPAINATTQMTTTRPSSSRTNSGSTSTVKPQPSSSGGPSSRTQKPRTQPRPQRSRAAT
jgi:hypothetical protein